MPGEDDKETKDDIESIIKEVLGDDSDDSDDDADDDSEDTSIESKSEASDDSKDEKPTTTGVDFSDPEVQKQLAPLFESWVDEQKNKADREKSVAELDGLVEEENFEELGKRFAQEFSQAKTRGKVQTEVLSDFLGKYYNQVFQSPLLQNLTAEEREKLDPRKYQDDISYLVALNDFMVGKGKTLTVEEQVEQRVAERLKAIENGEVGERVSGAAAVTGAPGAVKPTNAKLDPTKTKAKDLLRAGFNELIKVSN